MPTPKRFELPVPVLVREGSKKMVFANFSEFPKKMNREQELLRQFFSNALNARCTLAPADGDGNCKMVMWLKIQPSQVQTLLAQFLKDFVESSGRPNTFNTHLERDAATGLHWVVCNETGSKRCVRLSRAPPPPTLRPRNSRRRG